MAMSMSMTALATSAGTTIGVSGVSGGFTTPDTPVVQEDSIILYKEITAYNPEECVVNAPTITYTYTVTAGEAKNIYDDVSAHAPAVNVHAVTKAGITDNVKVTTSLNGTDTTEDATGTLALTPATSLEASANGKANRFPVTIDFSNITWTGSGVYRYVITETASEYTTSGVMDGDITAVRYLDVYVMDCPTGTTDTAPATPDGYVVYGYVCFTNNNDIDAKDTPTTTTVEDAGKTEGFVSTTAIDPVSGDPVDVTADSYHTFNLKVGKTLINDKAMNTNEFPFTITLENTTVTGAVLPIMTITGNATQTDLTAGSITATWEPTIANGATVTYTGIPCGTTVTIYETNNVAGTTYSSESDGAVTNADAKSIYTNEKSNEARIDNTVALTKATANYTVTFTNTLLQISPTGVVIRFAPYMLMLATGIFLLVFCRRRRENDLSDQF